MTNTINNVPRELLERVLNAGWGSETVNALDDLRDFLASAPSPAGVDGLSVVAYRVSLPGEPELGTWLDEDAENEPQMCLHEPLCRLSDALAAIAVRDARIEAQEAQIKILQSDANSWQSGYDEGRRMGGKHCALTIDHLAQRIGELEKLQARAVVLPERKPKAISNKFDMFYNYAWNACLDEVARLNGKGGV